MRKNTLIIYALTTAVVLCIGIAIGLATQWAYEPEETPGDDSKEPLREYLEERRRQLDAEDSIYQMEHPEDTLYHYHFDPEDEDAPIIRGRHHRSTDPIEAPAKESR